MKQAYNKPVLILESFTMTQTIAHNCGDNLDFSMATTKYKATCGWNIGRDLNIDGKPDVVFTTSGICDPTIGENDFGGVCYNNPSGGFNVFNS